MKSTSSRATTTTTTTVNILKRICYFIHFFCGIFAYIHRYCQLPNRNRGRKTGTNVDFVFACSFTVTFRSFCCYYYFISYFFSVFFLLAKVCFLTSYHFLRFWFALIFGGIRSVCH